ncbi:DUF4391 domain-containing protein [Candidatus Methylopumilus turicensis]|uniref:Methyl-accepting chemotaxis protein n=1 Tax=Candidatus Methylopumilus turicensis TaxID=1581680 RepID=A0A0B7J114_9PROT|nr:DUF4391 domain-containing protein [Candidatus Methylopumilus turicensis]CEN56468.1 conserved protein of unknown function [Candidatus Methylopumilus turicensis]
MGYAIYQYPQKAYVNKPIPKTKFYENANIPKSIKDAFVSQIQQITWAYKLSPETINLTSTKSLLEIQVFNIQLKTSELDEKVLLSIDKAIFHPIIFQLYFDDKVQVKVAYKRINESDESKWLVEQYFSSEWISINQANEVKTNLPIALDLNGLYEQVLKELLTLKANDGEGIKEQTLRFGLIAQKQKEIEQLQRKIYKEKQFNRKVAMNGQLKKLELELQELIPETTEH